MKYLFLISFLMLSNFSHAQINYCAEENDFLSPFIKDNQNIFKKLKAPYYFYFQGKNIEDLQRIKNCIDYLKCGKSEESIVDDKANYRLHLWENLSEEDLKKLMKSCPIKDLDKKLIVRYGGQNGRNIALAEYGGQEKSQVDNLLKASNPASFKRIPKEKAKETMNKIVAFLKAEKTTEATDLILKTWQIDLHGYELEFQNKKGAYATADHKAKKISYARDWLANPCDFVRMIRHEAEHVAQVKQMKSCNGNHNFSDHKMRERAAHLNDALFIPTVCPHEPERAKSIKDFCVQRFKDNYFNKK